MDPKRDLSPHLRGSLTAMAVLYLAAAGTVPEPAAAGTASTVNYAFSHELGSGVYEVAGRRVYVTTVSPAVSLVTRERTRVRLHLHTTLGLIDLRPQDVLDTRLPDNLSNVSLVPTAAWEYQVSNRLRLIPFLGLGAGKDLTTGAWNWIYTVGAASRLRLERGRIAFRIGSRLFYAGYTDRRFRFVDDYAALETGIDLRHRLGVRVGRTVLDAGIFAVSTVHLLSPQLVILPPDAVEMRSWWEAGVSVGTADPVKVLVFPLPRLGISLRFGEGRDAVRVILGKPF